MEEIATAIVEREALIARLQRAPVGTKIEIEGHVCTITEATPDFWPRTNKPICLICGFKRERHRNRHSAPYAICPYFRACCKLHREDHKTIAFVSEEFRRIAKL